MITFKIELEVLYCPKDAKDWKQTFQIYPVGLNESLVIDLEMLCDCPCERPENKVSQIFFKNFDLFFFRLFEKK